MNKLEQKIFDELTAIGIEYDLMYIVPIAAKICLEIGFKAYKAGNGHWDIVSEEEFLERFEDFKQEIL
jgi:urease accessory protein UreE